MMKSGSFQVVPSDRRRGNGHIMNRNFPVNIRKHSLYHEGDGALAQATQGGCGVSFLEIFKSCLDMVPGSQTSVALLM